MKGWTPLNSVVIKRKQIIFIFLFSGTLHYYINGVDQGVAANHIPPNVYGVVDLYGMAVSVSIVPHYSIFERYFNLLLLRYQVLYFNRFC